MKENMNGNMEGMIMKMMKFFLLTAAAVAAISCAKENLPVENETPAPEVELVPMTFTASYAEADDAESKVAYEGGATVWKVDDKIMLIASDGTATEFTATSVEGNRATFEGLTNEKAESYYAVSPASAYVGNDIANGKIYANIPQNQTAVAGSFDPKAFLSVASNEGSELYFKNSCTVVGFKFAAPAGVKSIRFTATDQTNLAGTGVVKTDKIPTHTWDGTYEGRSAFDMITLNAPEGGFLADTDYYLTIRANTCPNGIKVYVEYEDQVKSRNSSKPLFPEGVHPANMIRNLGQLDKNLSDVTPYDAYTLGFDIMVAGKTINKATYGDATLINEDSASKSINNAGVFFVNSNVEGVALGGGINNKSIIVIGNNSGTRSSVSRSGYIPLPSTTGDDYWIMSNISLDITNNSGYTFRANSTNTMEFFSFDNCHVNIPTGQQFIYIAGTDEIKNICIYNSEFLVVANNNNNFIKADKNHTIDNIAIENNVFYSADALNPAASFVLMASTNATVTNLIINKNTMYGAMGTSSAPLTGCNSTNCTITNNMFVVQSISGGNVGLVSKKISTTMNVTNNRCWIDNTSTYRIGGVSQSYAAQSGTAEQPGSLTPSAPEWDPANNKFILHKSFGATR